jgi:hypothetical protein
MTELGVNGWSKFMRITGVLAKLEVIYLLRANLRAAAFFFVACRSATVLTSASGENCDMLITCDFPLKPKIAFAHPTTTIEDDYNRYQ